MRRARQWEVSQPRVVSARLVNSEPTEPEYLPQRTGTRMRGRRQMSGYRLPGVRLAFATGDWHRAGCVRGGAGVGCRGPEEESERQCQRGPRLIPERDR